MGHPLPPSPRSRGSSAFISEGEQFVKWVPKAPMAVSGAWLMAWTPDRRARRGGARGAERKRAVKAGRRPPGGGALRARSVALHIMECEARQSFVIVPCAVGVGDALRSISIARWCWLGDPRSRAPFISSSEVRHGVVRPQPVGSISYSVSPQGGDHECYRARTGLRPSRSQPVLARQRISPSRRP